MRRLFVLGILLLLLLFGPQVFGQCQPTNSPTYDFSNSTSVAPNQVPFAAVTMNFSGNHRLTVGEGTTVTINWWGYNTAPLTGGSDSGLILTYALDNGQQGSPWYIPATMSGSVNYTFSAQDGWAGHIGHFRMTAKEKSGSGSFTPTTQDLVAVTVTSQAPGIYSYDNLPSNSYAMVSLNYNGTPNIPYQTTCPNAAEKDMLPTAQLNLSNTTSGENRNGVSFQGATTVVGQPVSATAYDYISFVPATTNNGVSFPGDVITVGAGGFVYCSAIGDFWQGFKDFQATIELALTFSQVTGFVGQNASLRNWCLAQYIPPDYNPNILLNAQPGATYVWGTALLLNSTWNSGFWLVISPGLAYSLTGTYTRQYCTHNPPPY